MESPWNKILEPGEKPGIESLQDVLAAGWQDEKNSSIIAIYILFIVLIID